MADVVSIEHELAQLDRAAEHAVVRFDSPAPIGPRAVVLPSAFNPPTTAHLALLDLGPDEATEVALLTTRNVAKGVYGASLPHRVGMLLAAAGAGTFAVAASNAARIADQGEALRRAYPGTVFDFIVGYDTLIRLFDATYYGDMEPELESFFAHHRVIATNRGEVSAEAVAGFLREPEVRDFAACIEVCELRAEHAAVSSSQAREDFEARPSSDVVGAEVAAYIQRHRLYRR
jgi:nicotinic acid mononucleotide adenylyltransferase